MENNTPSPKSFSNVILHLLQEMHCHVHIAKYPQDFSEGVTDPIELANISKENEALASEYADAISLLTKVNDELKKNQAEQTLEEEILLLDDNNVNNENQNPN